MAKTFTFTDPLDTPTNVSHTLTTGGSLPANETFHYRIQAINSTKPGSAKASSGLSEEKTFTTTDTENSIDISWDAVTGAAKYIIGITRLGSGAYYSTGNVYTKYSETNSYTLDDIVSESAYLTAQFGYAVLNPNLDLENEGCRKVVFSGGTEEDPVTFKDIYDACIAHGWSTDSVYWKSYGAIESDGTEDNLSGRFDFIGIIDMNNTERHFAFVSGEAHIVGGMSLGYKSGAQTFRIGLEDQKTKNKRYGVTFVFYNGYTSPSIKVPYFIGEFYGVKIMQPSFLKNKVSWEINRVAYFGSYFRIQDNPHNTIPTVAKNCYIQHGGYFRIQGGFDGGLDDTAFEVNMLPYSPGTFHNLRNIYNSYFFYQLPYPTGLVDQNWYYVKLNQDGRSGNTHTQITNQDLNYTTHLIDYERESTNNIAQPSWSNINSNYYSKYSFIHYLTTLLKVTDLDGNPIEDATVTVVGDLGETLLDVTTDSAGYVGEYKGQVTSATDNSITFSGVSWTDDEWIDNEFLVTSGTGVGQRAYIDDNNSDTLEFNKEFVTALDSTSNIIIIPYLKSVKLIYDEEYYPSNGQYTEQVSSMPWRVEVSKSGYITETVYFNQTTPVTDTVVLKDQKPVLIVDGEDVVINADPSNNQNVVNFIKA